MSECFPCSVCEAHCEDHCIFCESPIHIPEESAQPKKRSAKRYGKATPKTTKSSGRRKASVGKGGPRTSPGVLHTGCRQKKHKYRLSASTAVEKRNYSQSETSTTAHPKPDPAQGKLPDKQEFLEVDSNIPEETAFLDSEQDTSVSKSYQCHHELSSIQEETSILLEDIPTRGAVDNPDSDSDLKTNLSSTNENLNLSVDFNMSLENFVGGPLKAFMDIYEIFKIMKGPNFTLEQIPVGRKDGMYYVLDNTVNVERRKRGQRSGFWDDCGTWINASTPSTVYLYRENNFMSIRKNKGQYCIISRIRNKTEYSIQPQPTADEIITVRRLYQTLKTGSDGKEPFRRTWVEKSDKTMPEISNTIAVVEYIGTFPGRALHGSVKDTENNAVYIRTKPDVLKKLKNDLKHKSVKEVERELNQKTSNDFEKHRNEKQLRNTKHYLNKADQITSTTSNIADQIISVEEMTKTHEFVQTVKHLHGMKHPVITLFNDQQIIDIKRFCCRQGGVLGMDKTYNLGQFHVTPTVYKYIVLYCKR